MAPQALAQAQVVSIGSPFSQPRRKPAMKRVAGAERVVDVDREAGAANAVLQLVGNRAGIDEAAHRPLLEHDGRRRQRADAPDRIQHGLAAAGNHQLLLGADDQVDLADDRIEAPGDGLGTDVAVVAGVVAGQAPQVRAIVDVEDDLAAGGLGRADRLVAGGLDGGRREMRAADEDGAGRLDIGLVDVVLAQRHVGAIGAIEDVRRVAIVAHAENDEGGQPIGIGDDAIDGDALAHELLADEAPHVLVADAGDEPGLEAETRGADGGVGGAAADRFGEGGHVLQPPADLLSVKIHGRPADGDHVETGRCGHRWTFVVAHRPVHAMRCSDRPIKQIFHVHVNMEREFYVSLRLAAVATPSAMATQKVAASERKPA